MPISQPHNEIIQSSIPPARRGRRSCLAWSRRSRCPSLVLHCLQSTTAKCLHLAQIIPARPPGCEGDGNGPLKTEAGRGPICVRPAAFKGLYDTYNGCEEESALALGKGQGGTVRPRGQRRERCQGGASSNAHVAHVLFSRGEGLLMEKMPPLQGQAAVFWGSPYCPSSLAQRVTFPTDTLRWQLTHWSSGRETQQKTAVSVPHHSPPHLGSFCSG